MTTNELIRNMTRYFYLQSKIMLCMNDIDYMIYHDEYETLTEYNGFLTEV